MMISIETENALDKNPSCLHDENHKESSRCDITKAVYEKHNRLHFNGEKLEAILLKPEMRLGYPLSPLLFNIVLEALAGTKGQENEIIGI